MPRKSKVSSSLSKHSAQFDWKKYVKFIIIFIVVLTALSIIVFPVVRLWRRDAGSQDDASPDKNCRFLALPQ